jgi:uncharacterized protein (TIGR02246 family)
MSVSSMTHDDAEELLLRRIRAWKSEDLEAIMADYAPSVVHVTPHGERIGAESMREENQRYLDEYTDFDVKLTRLIVDGEAVALEWTWTDTRRADGLRRSVDDAIVFIVRDEKIAYWREYFDAS